MSSKKPVQVGPKDEWKKPKIFWFITFPLQLFRTFVTAIGHHRKTLTYVCSGGMLLVPIAGLLYHWLVQPKFGLWLTIVAVLVSYFIGIYFSTEPIVKRFEVEIMIKAISLGVFLVSFYNFCIMLLNNYH